MEEWFVKFRKISVAVALRVSALYSGEMRCVRCSEKDLMEWPSFLWIICIKFF